MSRERRRYTQAEKDAAIAALMTSAVRLDDGSWHPNYRHVSQSLNIARSTLRSWWTSRDEEEDRQLSPPIQRARDRARERGADTLLSDLVSAMRRQVDYISHPAHYDTSVVIDKDGRARVAGVPVHQAARALQSLVQAHRHLQTVLAVQPERVSHEERMHRLREAVRRTGLDKLYSTNKAS